MRTSVKDYGDRAHDRFEILSRFLVLLLAAIAVSALVYGETTREARHRAAVMADAKAWTIAGPPCPHPAANAYVADLEASHMHASRAFEFMGVTFARSFGHVSCAEIHANGGRSDATYPVCQFTSPGALEVTTARGEFYFYPSTGPATISVPDGRPMCVMASKFKG
jgi:hypothetical protein